MFNSYNAAFFCIFIVHLIVLILYCKTRYMIDHFHRFHYYNILIFTKRVQIQIQQYRQIMLCRVVCMIDKKVQRISMWCNFKHYVKNILSNEI